MATLPASRTCRDARPAETATARTDTNVALACSLVATAVGLAVVALLGPLAFGVVDYHVTETLRNQTIGLDAVSLLVVAPLSLLGARLVLRRHVAGPTIALGIGAYTAYMLVQYVLGPEYERLPGNNELLFPVYVILFARGWAVALVAWHLLGHGLPPLASERQRVIGRLVLPLLAFLAFVRYLPALADWMSATPSDEGYLAGPTFAWTIAMLDLGVFLPATIAACVGLARRTPWAQQALYLVVGWFGLVGPAVAAMAIAMAVNDDPNASTGSVAFMTALGLAFAAVAVALLRPLLAGPDEQAHDRDREARREQSRVHRSHSGRVGSMLALTPKQPRAGAELRRILVATDGSGPAAQAVELGAELAAEHEAELTFVHVVPAVDLAPVLGFGLGGAFPHEPSAADRTLLDAAVAVAKAHGVSSTTALLAGDTVDEIVAYADAHDVDLTVVGSRGHGAIARAVLGSVSRGVLGESKRPVLVVRGASAPASADARDDAAVGLGRR